MSQGPVLLAFAIVFEVIGTTCMKFSEGFTRLWPSLGIAVFYAASFACLTLALRHLEISVALVAVPFTTPAEMIWQWSPS